MAELIWTSEANRWIEKIYQYISKENPQAAYSVVNGIYEKAQVLLDHPKIGYIYEHESGRNIRILLYGHYRIAYEISENERTIYILGIFHGAMEIENYLSI